MKGQLELRLGYERNQLYPGAVHIPAFLSIDRQRANLEECRALAREAGGFYRPTTSAGSPFRLRMFCLGHHWSPHTHAYGPTRSDFDGRPVLPLPESWARLAAEVAAEVGMALAPGIAIANHYDEGGALGLHRDCDESFESIAAGAPVVSVSIGDSAVFAVGGLEARDPLRTVVLHSGDAFVLGGPSRLRYHAVREIHAGTSPPELAMRAGRLSLTFRAR